MSTNQELSPPLAENSPLQNGEEHIGNSVEVPALREKDTRQPAVTVQSPQDNPVAIPVAPATAATTTVPPEPVQAGPAGSIADDVDLIEKEWVDKAKAIVEATQDDPRKQKNEISKVKAEYIQKRFNKTIKVDSAA